MAIPILVVICALGVCLIALAIADHLSQPPVYWAHKR